MNVTCLKENFKKNLDNALRIIKHNSTLPILNNFLLSTEKGKLKISSTDLEIGFNSWVSSRIDKEGSITVPAQLLSQFVNNLPNKNINLEVKDLKLYLNCDNIKAHINGLSAEDFPIIPKIDSNSVLVINSKILKDSLNCVINSSAASLARPEISSIYIQINPDQIKFVATDSFRLAYKTIYVLSSDLAGKVKIDFEKSKNIILPLRTAGELLRILEGQDSNVQIIIDDNQIMFDLENTNLISRLILGNYPDYEVIIPKSSETRCYLNKNDLEESIRLSGCFSSKLNDITVKTNSVKSQIEVFSSNSNQGSHNAKIDSEIKGRDVSIVFNWRYFLDGLKNIEGDEMVLEFNGDIKPAMIKSAKNSDFFYILMPIRNI